MSVEAKHRTFAYLFACASRHLAIARYSEAKGNQPRTGDPLAPPPPPSSDPIIVGEEALTGGSFYDAMSCLTFCALSVEAAVNHIGGDLFDHWKIYEKKLSTREKIDLLSQLKKKIVDFGAMPFSYYTQLQRFRNVLAHGKTETVESPGLTLLDAQPDWMSSCTVAEAERAVEATRGMIDGLFEKFHTERFPLAMLASGHGSGTSEE